MSEPQTAKNSVFSKNKWKKVLIATGLFFVTIAVMAAGFYFGLNKQNSPAAVHTDSHKKVTILLLGINQRKNDIGRSNVTCVVTIDPDTKKISMLWVPRDSRVKIPGHEWNKIGHAYAYGGPKLSEQTVSELLGIPIDYYVAVNMDGFKKVIDALGGVDINVDKRMYYYDPYDEGEVDNDGLIDLQPGQQHMDGNTALQYVRFRHDEMGDIGRIERQQKFAKALLADVVSPSIIMKLPGAIKEASAVFNTDMPLSEMLSLSTVLSDAYKQGLNTAEVAGRPVYIDGISYWIPDIVAMRRQIAEIQQLKTDESYLTAANLLEKEYESSVPAGATADFQGSGGPVAANTVERATVPTEKPKIEASTAKSRQVPTNTEKTAVADTKPTATAAKSEALPQNKTTETK